MKAALILAAALNAAPSAPTQPPKPAPDGPVDSDFVHLAPGQTLECVAASGCIAVRPEVFKALIDEARRGLACRRTL